MFSLLLHTSFLFLVAVMVAYMVRHYVFSLSVLYVRKKQNNLVRHGICHRPSVSILIPARNEESVLGRLIQRITELTYPKDKLEIIIIDDGSTDRTGRIADEFSKLYDSIKVIHRGNEGGKGKPAALNAGLKLASGEIVLCFDADYYPQLDIVQKLAAYFIDPEVGAVQGRVTVENESASLVSRLVTLERIGGYRVDQQARDNLGLIPQYGGTVGGFRRKLLLSLGGWDSRILAEDTDLTFRVVLAGYKVRYVNEAECYEEAVTSWQAYWRQRSRWATGHMQCFFKHFLSVAKSSRLSLKEKVDGLLLLGVYFIPLLAVLSWVLGALIFLYAPLPWLEWAGNVLPAFAYSSVGNFALFFELGVGIYLDGRSRMSWLLPVLILSFMINVAICFWALSKLFFCKITKKTKNHVWAKTVHNGGLVNGV